MIVNKLLPLVFFKLRKVWEQKELYLLPYIKNKKNIATIAKAMTTNKKLYDKLIDMLDSFINGQTVFGEN